MLVHPEPRGLVVPVLVGGEARLGRVRLSLLSLLSLVTFDKSDIVTFKSDIVTFVTCHFYLSLLSLF